MSSGKEKEQVPVVTFSDVVMDLQTASDPLSFELMQGQFGFVRGDSLALIALGIQQPYAGKVTVLGETWESKSVRNSELHRRRISYVGNSHSEFATEWVENLDVDENVILGLLFDRGVSSRAANERMNELAMKAGLENGVPSSRPDSTSLADLVRSQWVRAFLADNLILVVLENPLEGAPRSSVPGLMDLVSGALNSGVAVIWVDEERPDFDKLGVIPDLEC